MGMLCWAGLGGWLGGILCRMGILAEAYLLRPFFVAKADWYLDH